MPVLQTPGDTYGIFLQHEFKRAVVMAAWVEGIVKLAITEYARIHSSKVYDSRSGLLGDSL